MAAPQGLARETPLVSLAQAVSVQGGGWLPNRRRRPQGWACGGAWGCPRGLWELGQGGRGLG